MQYQGLLNVECRLLTGEEKRLFDLLWSLDDEKIVKVHDELMGGTDGFLYQVLLKRLENHSVTIKRHTAIFTALLCKNPSHAVMWAYTLWLMEEKQGSPVMLGDLSRQFHEGIPRLDGYKEAWDKQKGHTYEIKDVDNLLDNRYFLEVKGDIVSMGGKIPVENKEG